MGILDQYREQLAKDKETASNDSPDGSGLTETQCTEDEKRLNELRNNANSIENVYAQKKAQLKKMSESDIEALNLIKEEDVTKIVVKHAYCEECGEELISDTPALFNPYTKESIALHICKKCGKKYNLQYAYPRLVFMNNNGEEIPAFTR